MRIKKKVCKRCGKKFSPVSVWQQYCSNCYAENAAEKLKKEEEDENGK